MSSLAVASSRLEVRPPITSNSISNFDALSIHSDAKDTRIVVHNRFPELAKVVLKHKLAHGSTYEKELYKGLGWQQLTSRLIEKRPLVFMGASDHTMLRSGKFIRDPDKQWDRNGTDEQHLNEDLTLEEYLSYDEIMLGSLIGVSGPSYFLNDGARHNCGRPGKSGSFEDRGIIIGLVGARFERFDRMDSVFMLAPVKQPRQHPALTEAFMDFFQARRSSDIVDFDFEVYQARIRITAELLLHEACSRAASDVRHRKAYVYVVGLGLGLWQENAQQADTYIDAFADAINDLPEGHNIAKIEFAYLSNLNRLSEDQLHQAGRASNISIVFSRRNPAAKLEGDDADKLLVLSYAWDGNAFPGNEYWQGSLMGSGDPAAACMSTVGELHSPLVNPEFTKRIKVAGGSNTKT